MNNAPDSTANRRILVIDDNEAIHADVRKSLSNGGGHKAALEAAEAALFGGSAAASHPQFDVDCASQGEAGLLLVQRSMTEQRPYAVAFIDVRMPPGWDGIETTRKVWEIDPEIQIIICTAHSDYSWQQIFNSLGSSDRLFILKKPFDPIEVLQLAESLSHKWQGAKRVKAQLESLEQIIRQRSSAAHESGREISSAEGKHSVQELEIELRDALGSGQLCVHYQPLVDIATRRLVSFEALARWQHPVRGWIPPAEFIPVAEASGLILPLGEFVLRSVCEQVVRWQHEGLPTVPVAINVSAAQLRRHDMIDSIFAVLRSAHMAPDRLIVELTESALMTNLESHTRDLRKLRAAGVGIEMDDFGTGYSSLSYLKQLPIDTLKIDRSFISQVDTNAVDTTIVRAILSMAHSLGLRVVAEGVETQPQLQMLKALGCEFAQGFFFSKPLAADACRLLLVDISKRTSFTETLRMEIAERSRPIRAGSAQ